MKTGNFGIGRHSSTSYELGEALEQDLERRAASRRKAILDALLGHVVACLQKCRHHPAAKKVYMLFSKGRVLISSASCP